MDRYGAFCNGEKEHGVMEKQKKKEASCLEVSQDLCPICRKVLHDRIREALVETSERETSERTRRFIETSACGLDLWD